MDSDVDCLNVNHSWNDRLEYDAIVCFEDSEEAERDGDEHNDFWAITDEDEDQSQDLEMYEADCEDQDTDMDSDEEDYQNIDANEDEDETSTPKPNIESSQATPLDEDTLQNPTPTLPQIFKPEPSPTPEPHHETIALGQHHLWMM